MAMISLGETDKVLIKTVTTLMVIIGLVSILSDMIMMDITKKDLIKKGLTVMAMM